METIQFDALELDAVEQDDPNAHWLAGFPFSSDRPGETTMESTDYTVVYNELDPGAHIGTHRDGSDELLIVLAGTVEAVVGSETATVDAGTLTVIPADTDHTVRNIGSETARMVGLFGAAPVDSTFESEPTLSDGD
ncbi:Cupin domain-containing protein [Halohasta litchfieldiae]|jgi:mannose-6-phosphate isomerase-like protein (cupin superfamily)|uniref:Cupin domain-containing protein n=1 Tax=Halohasta litchfieldiae TaxID=1073996 RepID=A0A1H6RWC7_9EURY|nr:cupin domain-containing protein [Halohasta litchfieldiae]ATW89356.1 Cupin domain-containing protein [Halohasta litchfieldiae]SEI60041.1 Cupin domain-containing protein [Halohasta litchfieldiae]